MSDLFGREIEVVTNKKTFNGDDFTIYFDVPFDDGTEPNIASIELYNLTDATINELNSGIDIYINAGYRNDIGTIFLGNIQLPETEWSGVDKVTSLDCIDSGETWFKTKIKRTYAAGTTGYQILDDLWPLTGLALGEANLPGNIAYKGGKTFDTTLAEAIAEVAKDCGAKVHVNKKIIYIRPKNAGNNIHYTIDKEHGLIGSPTKTEKEEVTGKDADGKDIKAKISGWKVVSLLNHRITTDAIIEIVSRTANGTFRVESGKHTANGSNFYTEMEVYPL